MRLHLFIFFSLALMFFCGGAEADTSLHFDRNPVHVDETFTLEIRSDNTDASAPSLVLPEGIEQLQRNNISSRSIVNGKISAEQRWVYKLVARKTGEFEFGPVQVGKDKSNRLTLTVDKKNVAETGTRATKLMLRADVDTPQAFVQQQVIVTIKLFRAVPVRFAQITEPAPEHTLVQQLGDDVEYETEENGQAYFVLERRYALFPQQAGELEIAPIQFNGDITIGRSPDFFGAMSDTEPVSLRTTPIHVTVKPAVNSATWLPARAVELNAQVLPLNRRIAVGEPITLNLHTQVIGQIAAALPPLNFVDNDDRHYYPDQAKDSTAFNAQGMVLTRTQKIAVVPTRSGTLQLDPIELPWFNTQTGEQQLARITFEPITVTAADHKINPVVTTPPAEPVVSATPTPTLTPSIELKSNSMWIGLSAALGILWLLTLMAWWATHRRRKPVPAMPEKKSLALHADDHAIRKACALNDVSEARRLLLQWAKKVTQQPDLNWAQLIQRSGDYQSLLRDLESALYAASPMPWQGQRLAEKLHELESIWRQSQPPNHASAPSLNP